MPDDKEIVAEQVPPVNPETPTPDADFDGGFDDKPADPVEKPAEKPAEPKPVEKADGAPTEQPKPAEKPAEELSETQKNLAERAKKFEAASPAESKPAEQPKPAEKPTEQPKVAAGIAELLKNPALKDAKITVDGQEVTAAKFAEDYSEIAQATQVFGGAIAQEAAQKAVAAEKIGDLRQQVSDLIVLVQVQSAHPDVLKVLASKDYQEFKKTLSPGQQRMEESADPSDVIALMDAFKEKVAKDSAVKAKDEAAKAKKKKDDLHADTLKGGGKPGGEAGPKTEDDEFNAGFGQ